MRESRRVAITANVDMIMRLSREMVLSDALDRFRIDGHPYLRNYRDVLIAAGADDDGWKVSRVVADAALDAKSAAHERNWAARKAVAGAPIVPDDDADVMGDLGF